jgi:hypothetical protein
MKLRDLLRHAIENGHLDKEVFVRVVKRNKEPGSVISERLVRVSRFSRMSGPSILEQDNYVVIEDEDFNNAKEIRT